jgi:predicted nucleic acid-binding protein
VVLSSESELHWENLRDTLLTARVTGPMARDALIAALCKQHGVAQRWSADRDFSWLAGVRVNNPVVD